MIASLFKSTIFILKVVRIIGNTVLVIGFLQALIGILLFTVISQDYEADLIYSFNTSEQEYQVRRYSFGFATLDETKYTFETYKLYQYFPFEKQIDKRVFFELDGDLKFNSEHFTLSINGQDMEVTSTNGEKIEVQLNKY